MVTVKTADKDAVMETHRAYRLHPPHRLVDKIHKHRIIGKRLIAHPQIVRIVHVVDMIATRPQGLIHLGYVLGAARQCDGQYLSARSQGPDRQRAMEVTHLDDRSRSDLAAGFRKGLLFWFRNG